MGFQMGIYITRNDVTKLRGEAGQAGDLDMVAICDTALSGERNEYSHGDSRLGDDESHAWRQCLLAIEAGASPNYPGEE